MNPSAMRLMLIEITLCLAFLQMFGIMTTYRALVLMREYQKICLVELTIFMRGFLPHIRSYSLRWEGHGHSYHWMLASSFLQWDRWDELVMARSLGEQTTLRQIANFMLHEVEELVDKYAQGNPENLRLIYWFDN
jgi:hypothetical protein